MRFGRITEGELTEGTGGTGVCGRVVLCCLPRITMMKHNIVAALIVSAVFALLPGCGRKTANNATTPPDTAPTAPAPHSSASGVTNQTGIDSKAEMVRIPGGRFMMGDQAEVDATPHEVLVGPFFIDQHLVTQEQY